MTSKYKTFWVYDKGGDMDSPYKYNCWPHKVENHYNNNPVIEVIERRALDEALHIIMETQKFLKTTSNITGASSPSIEFKIDTFLSQIKAEGE